MNALPVATTTYDISASFHKTSLGGKRTVSAIASANASIDTITAHILHARCTSWLSDRSGQKRSKKKPAPKMVATAIPQKML